LKNIAIVACIFIAIRRLIDKLIVEKSKFIIVIEGCSPNNLFISTDFQVCFFRGGWGGGPGGGVEE